MNEDQSSNEKNHFVSWAEAGSANRAEAGGEGKKRRENQWGGYCNFAGRTCFEMICGGSRKEEG